MCCTNYRPIIEFYPESEAEDMYLGYEYGEITTLADFIAPVYNIQMDENLEEITTNLAVVSLSDDKKRKDKYRPEQIRRFIEILQEEGVSIPVATKICMILIFTTPMAEIVLRMMCDTARVDGVVTMAEVSFAELPVKGLHFDIECNLIQEDVII